MERKENIGTGPVAAQIVLVITEYDTDKEELERIFAKRWISFFVKDASAAVSIIKSGLTPTLLIVDAEPRRDEALKTVGKMKKYIGHIPIMMIDSAVPKDYEIRYLMVGITDFIHRPFSADVVLQRVGRTIRNYSESMYVESELLSVNDALKGEKHRMLKLTLQLMSSLASTIDAKDEYTKGHSNRVSMAM